MFKKQGTSVPWLWLSIPWFGGLYAAQGITGSLVQTGLPTTLRESGMALDSIGLLYLLYLPWAIKFLWAPLLDRYWVARIGKRRTWILACQSTLVVCFLIGSQFTLHNHLFVVLGILLVVATLASTQDIATDALAVEATTPEQRGFVSSAGVGGAYLGFLIGIGLWLPVYAAAGWRMAMLVMAACLAIATIPALFARRLERDGPAAERASIPTRASVLNGLRNKPLRNGLVFLGIYQSGLRLGIALLGPFLVDVGMTLTEIGWLNGTGGAIVGFSAAILGGFVIRRLGARWSMFGCAVFQAIVYSLLAVVAFYGIGDRATLTILVLALSAATALSFVALYTTMMGWCSPAQTGTDFALLQSADAIVAIALASVAGAISQQFGHEATFALSAILLCVGAAAALIVNRNTSTAIRPSPDVAPSTESVLPLKAPAE